MIKVNLLRQSSTTPGTETQVGTFTNLRSPNFEGSSQKPLFVRIFAIAVPVLLAYGVGYYNTDLLKNEIKKLNLQLKNFETEISNLKPELDLIEKLNVEKNKIAAQISDLRSLSKKRYLLAKIMDSVQTLIPEKAWLVKMSIKGNTIIIEGRAPDDATVSSFMENLEQSSFFANVTWIDSREVNEPQGIVKLFNIQFNLENI